MIRTAIKRSLEPLSKSSKLLLPVSTKQAFPPTSQLRFGLLSNIKHFATTPPTMLPTETKKVSTTNAASPAGPYSQAIVAGNLVFVSGQIPQDKEGNLIQGSITDKTRACALNVKAIVEAAGSSVERITKCTVFIDDMANFAEMNAEYEKHFAHRPARSCVAVKTLPKNVPVEIECIAVL